MLKELHTTEDQVRGYFINQANDYMNPKELKIYSKSLDCALATLIYCEKNGINCPKAEGIIYDAVTEPGEFWESCLVQAKAFFHDIDVTTEANARLAVAKAVTIGFDMLVHAFEEGL